MIAYNRLSDDGEIPYKIFDNFLLNDFPAIGNGVMFENPGPKT